VSTRLNYGTGAPVPGYFQIADFNVLDSQTIVAQRNTSRLPAYERWDLRVNKSFVHPRWKMTLYGEVLNTLNHKNLRYLGIVGDYNAHGFANLAWSLSRVPAVGLSVEF
jgi:predicted deacetylase